MSRSDTEESNHTTNSLASLKEQESPTHSKDFDDSVNNVDQDGNASDSNSSATISSAEDSSDSDTHDVGTHLKSGSLSFGLPTSKDPPARQVLKSFAVKPAMTYRGLPLQKKPLQNARIQQELQELGKINDVSEELKEGYTLLSHLMSDSFGAYNEPFLEELDPEAPGCKEYLKVIKEPIFFNQVRQRFFALEYKNVTSLVRDIRRIFENTYRYYGPSNSFSKRAMDLEYFMEQEISKLPDYLKELCSLERTHPDIEIDETEAARSKSGRIVIQNKKFFSRLLFSVKGCRAQRDKDAKLQRQEAMKEARRNKELEIVRWEETLVSGKIKTQLQNSWEIPQIGQFLFLANSALNISPVPQFELERCLLVPQSSLALRSIITTLVSSPIQRPKISEKPFMPYNTWAKKMANKVFQWYKFYQKENGNAEKAFENLGIEPTFWKVCGETNPFQTMLFHEMSFYQRVWLLKALCDYTVHNHKSVAEVIAEQPEEMMREFVLGTDLDGNQYVYFPQFISFDLRIYRRKTPQVDDADDDFPQSAGQEEEKSARMFSKEQLKHYKSIIRRSKSGCHKKRKNEEDEWFQSQTAKKKAKRKRVSTPKFTPPPVETRTRPTNLRQRPKMRFTEDLDSSDEEFEVPVRKFNGTRSRRSKEPTPPPASEESESDSAPEQIELAQVKNTRCRSIKKKRTCDTCGKVFPSAGALRGHLAVHSKMRSQNVSRESSPVQAKESISDLSTQEKSQKPESTFDEAHESLPMDLPLSPKTQDEDVQENGEDTPVKEEVSPVKTEDTQPSIKKENSGSKSALEYCLFLVVSSPDELRILIQSFGPLPTKPKKEKTDEIKSKNPESDDDETDNQKQEAEEEDIKEPARKLSPNETDLYNNLCSLYLDVQTFEGKLRVIQKTNRRRMFNEFHDWNKRVPGYVDPAEEAWMSEPEVPVPSPAVESPKVSSSSTSSEDEYYDDGVRKRKLRKRKAKKNVASNYVTSAEPTPVPSPLYEDESEKLSVSSRGRIRRQRKMVDYDQLDFDKLAEEADSGPKEKKKRVVEPKLNEQELQEAAKNLQLPSSGVKKYLFGSGGNVVGYMDNNNKIHNSVGQPKEGAVQTPPVRPISSLSEQKPLVSSGGPPVVVLSAVNSLRSSVCLRVQGPQALEIANAMKNSGPGKDIKINHCNQIFILNTNNVILTKRVPGWPDCDMTNPVEALAKKRQERDAARARDVDRSPLKQKTSHVATPVWGAAAAAKASESSPTQPPKSNVPLMSNGRPMHVRLNLAGQQKNQTLYAVPNSSGGYSLTSTLSSRTNAGGPNTSTNSHVAVSPIRPVVQNPPVLNNSAGSTQAIQHTSQANAGFVRVIQQRPNQQVIVQNLSNSAGQSNVSSPQITRPIYVSNSTAQPQRVFIQPAEQPVTQTTVVYQQPQPQIIQQVIRQPVLPKPQNKIVVVQTAEGQKICIQTPDGRLIVLTDEQLAPLIANGTIKIQNSQ